MVTERKLIPGLELHKANGHEIKSWARLRRALINLKFETIQFKNDEVMLYDGEVAIRDNYTNKTYFIVRKEEISKILKSLPLDVKGRIKKMEFEKKEREEREKQQEYEYYISNDDTDD